MLKMRSKFLALLLLFCLLTCACAPISAIPSPTSPPTATATTDQGAVSIAAGADTARIPSYFTGFSIEPQMLCQFLALEQSNPAVDQFIARLARPSFALAEPRWMRQTGSPIQPALA